MIKVNNNNFSVYLEKKLYIDDDGYLWYSTRNGVVKEMGNGKNFFFEYAFDKRKHNHVLNTFAILKSSKNQIWACTIKGINILDLNTKTSKWIESTYPNTDVSIYFTDIAEDKLGNIWLATDKNYLYRYSPNNQLITYKLDDSDFYATDKLRHREALTKITNILDDNSLVLHQNNKWIHFKNEQGSLLHIENSKDYVNPSSTISVPNGSLFKANTSGNYTYKNKVFNYSYLAKIDKQIIENPFSNIQYIPIESSKNFNNAINFTAINSKDLLLLKMNNNGSQYELIEEDTITFKHTITNTIIDLNGYFWLHTEDGLHKIRYNDTGFKKHINYKNISCRGLTETKNGDIYLFTYQNIFKKDKGSNSFKKINNVKDEETYNKIKNLSYNFYNQNDKIFWFYGFHNSLIAFNVSEGTFKTYEIGISANIVDAEPIGNNSLLLATSKGLYSFNFDSKSFKNENVINSNINLTNIPINCITLTRDEKTLWIATTGKNALIKQNVESKQTTVFNTFSKEFQLIDNSVKLIYEDSKNNIWLGTNNGIQEVNPDTYDAMNYNTLSGFTNANIAGILEEKDNFWISTFSGLVKLNKASRNIQTYYDTDGITHNEFNTKSAFKASDSTLYFGGLNGITSFNPSNISNKNKTYSLTLTDYQLYNKKKKENVSIKSLLSKPDEIKVFNIPYLQNYLTLNFSINDVFNAKNNRYQYRINEISEEWIDLGNYSKIELRGLNSGDYNLEVRGFSSNGNTTNTLKYEVKINQVFYKKSWFVVLIVFVVFTFISIRNTKRRRRLKRHFKLKSKVLELESKAMRAQMNPHFIFNTLNGMQSVMLLKGERAANKYFTSFSKLLRLTLDMSNSEYVLLKNEIQYLKSYLELENLRLDNKLDIEFNIDSNLDIKNSSIPCMLFQPIIENAIIHGLTPKKKDLKLIVNFKKDEQKLIGEIIDNGIGRNNAAKLNKNVNPEHKSWATHIMKERINTANTINDEKIIWSIVDLFDNLKQAKGTKVTLSIPLKKAASHVETEWV